MALPNLKEQRGILFDWGGTLMREFPEFSGRMVDWPQVEAIPGAQETLATLAPTWTLAIATNAEESLEPDIRAALARVRLDRYIDRVYCFRSVGVKKPDPHFFQHILADLRLDPDQVFMVGDSFETDILGAVNSGLRAFWLNQTAAENRQGPGYQTINALSELPARLV